MADAPRASRPNLARLGLRAAGIAHDLAQPITAALLASRKVRGEGLGRLQRSLARMTQLLETLRSDLRDATPAKKSARVDLDDAGEELREGLTPSQRQRTRIRLRGEAAIKPLVLQRLLANLVSNALKHGSGMVHVVGSARAGKLEITVTGGPAKAPTTKGWGIGLLSCQDLARRHQMVLRVRLSSRGSVATLASRA